MNLDQLADVLVANAKKYRNENLVKGIVPKLSGRQVTREIVQWILDPYFSQIMAILPSDAGSCVSKRFKDYVPKALDCVKVNTHMHKSRQTESLDQDLADALLVGFVNQACIPLDLALYSQDLLPE